MSSKSYISHNDEETKTLGRNLAEVLNPGTIITLTGTLGSGKTTFSQGFGSFFNIKRMLSPTYTLIRQYLLPTTSSELNTLYHIDLYRLANADDVLALGIEEIISDKQSLVLIEWPEKIAHLLPPKSINIKFTKLKSGHRRIIISSPS